MREAETHAGEDKRHKEEIEVRNQADQAVYGAEKFVRENAEKVPADARGLIDGAVTSLKEAIEKGDVDGMKQGLTALMDAQHKAAEALYRSSAASPTRPSPRARRRASRKAARRRKGSSTRKSWTRASSRGFMDFYIVLGVGRDASLGEVKKAYRRLARRYHPDVNPGDGRAALRFREIAQAYEILSDQDRRRRYDRNRVRAARSRAARCRVRGVRFLGRRARQPAVHVRRSLRRRLPRAGCQARRARARRGPARGAGPRLRRGDRGRRVPRAAGTAGHAAGTVPARAWPRWLPRGARPARVPAPYDRPAATWCSPGRAGAAGGPGCWLSRRAAAAAASGRRRGARQWR